MVETRLDALPESTATCQHCRRGIYHSAIGWMHSRSGDSLCPTEPHLPATPINEDQYDRGGSRVTQVWLHVGDNDCWCSYHFEEDARADKTLAMFARIDPPAAPKDEDFTLLTVLKAAANYIILPEQMEQLAPGARESIIKGLTWAIHEVESQSAPPAPDEADKALVEAIAEPWICVEDKPCEETVAVHWQEMLTAFTAALAQARKEGAQGAWEKAGESVRQLSIRSEKYPHRYVSAATFKTRAECALEREAKGGDPK